MCAATCSDPCSASSGQFIRANRNRTGPQLEREYGNGASLLLARLSAWLRLTYLLGLGVHSLLSAISIFVAASSGSRFLTEFIETGGVITVLDILAVDVLSEADKRAAVLLLHHVANAGRHYKELICRHNGTRLVAAALIAAEEEPTQAAAQLLLVNLGRGNPKFAMHILVTVLGALGQVNERALEAEADGGAGALNSAQRCAAQATRALFAAAPAAGAPGAPAPEGVTSHGVLSPIGVVAGVAMLGSTNFKVQYEATELLKLLRAMGGVDADVLLTKELVSALDEAAHSAHDEQAEGAERGDARRAVSFAGRAVATAGDVDSETEDEGESGGTEGGKSAMAPVAATLAHATQQGAVAKHMRSFAEASVDPGAAVALFREEGAVPALLCALANTGSYVAQKHAADLLTFMVALDSAVDADIAREVGTDELVAATHKAMRYDDAQALNGENATAVVAAVRARRNAARMEAAAAAAAVHKRLAKRRQSVQILAQAALKDVETEIRSELEQGERERIASRQASRGSARSGGGAIEAQTEAEGDAGGAEQRSGQEGRGKGRGRKASLDSVIAPLSQQVLTTKTEKGRRQSMFSRRMSVQFTPAAEAASQAAARAQKRRSLFIDPKALQAARPPSFTGKAAPEDDTKALTEAPLEEGDENGAADSPTPTKAEADAPPLVDEPEDLGAANQ